MISLRQSVRLCAVYNGNNVPVRQVSSSIKKLLDGFEAKKSTYQKAPIWTIWCKDLMSESFIFPEQTEARFNTVAENTIHRMRCIEGMGWLMYPGSLAAVPKEAVEYMKNPQIELNKLIDFDNMKVNGQWSTWDWILKLTRRAHIPISG